MTLCFRVVVGGLILVGLSAFGGAESAAPTAAQPPPVTTSATERALTTTDAVPTTTEKAASKKPCSYPGQEIVYRGRKRCLSEERRMLIYYDLVGSRTRGMTSLPSPSSPRGSTSLTGLSVTTFRLRAPATIGRRLHRRNRRWAWRRAWRRTPRIRERREKARPQPPVAFPSLVLLLLLRLLLQCADCLRDNRVRRSCRSPSEDCARDAALLDVGFVNSSDDAVLVAHRSHLPSLSWGERTLFLGEDVAVPRCVPQRALKALDPHRA
jgi:hypothetical protein